MEPLRQRLLASYGVRLEIVTAPHPAGGWPPRTVAGLVSAAAVARREQRDRLVPATCVAAAT
ncbi:hypothetical protein ACQP2T_48310 [Nonomuraea sp. CA-143628]|uniref:hypothetical protein n=1 Tax=Nonomuraea sp. CA-143628 TaxID=3239997 RepID=UPI003D8FB463